MAYIVVSMAACFALQACCCETSSTDWTPVDTTKSGVTNTDKDACPSSFNQMGGFARDKKLKLKCSCNAGQTSSGSIYGSKVYTTDSSVCRAALHAGVIDKDGGKVKAKSYKGCGKYKGTKKNGVTTASWGSYEASFYFPKAGKGKCE